MTRHIKANEDTLLDNANQFYQLCKDSLTVVDGTSHRNIYFVSAAENANARTQTVLMANSLTGTRKIQAMQSNSKGSVKHRRLSCFCLSDSRHISDLCGDNWKKTRLVNSKGKNTMNAHTSSTIVNALPA